MGAKTPVADEKQYISSKHVEVARKCREGPGHIYEVPGALYKQPEASKQTAPSYTLSRAPRLKETISTTPGPGNYEAGLSSVGPRQPLSPNRSPQRVNFGSSTREQSSKLFMSSRHVADKRGTQGPPPGSYELPGALGPQVTKPSSPSFSLHRTNRLREKYDQLSKTMPAVGQYETWNSIGKQTLSLSKTMPAYGFGSSSREKEGQRFMSSTHAKMLRGSFSPPNYNHQQPENTTGFGKQQLSCNATLPSYGFGSQPRLQFKTSTTPGPGSYEN
ncbi:hypothetical protein HYH02_000180 [Chlamydomonas schloesseri]|uniref:Flagellar associated protein n=1 Tax=Chlamydomonas schloesseri TaxID=2026947 RepID=A0A835WNB6_9CHLO|nr:hypothetical protein HYH02_000180 [Chlamydomonas schloesseri]|eukprot:KAG2450076.1 hypothetical protein HYH02_000180 [Chlamydomonas schloesseri]